MKNQVARKMNRSQVPGVRDQGSGIGGRVSEVRAGGTQRNNETPVFTGVTTTSVIPAMCRNPKKQRDSCMHRSDSSLKIGQASCLTVPLFTKEGLGEIIFLT
jgi:hypothetical protein